jgi:subfamily B ATP-binding cassette protein HlyB/CyaB
VGALLVMEGDGFTVGMLVAFQMFASRMSQPMLRLVGLWQEFQQASVAVKRLGDVMDMPTEPFTVMPSRSRRVAGHIEVAGLGFRYSEQHPFVYRNLNLSLKPGQLTVLMGPSGSGKSTLTKLMLGFYPPSEGQITIDGRDVRNLSANELRSWFGVVPQETLLFAGTIYDNLVMANPHASFRSSHGRLPQGRDSRRDRASAPGLSDRDRRARCRIVRRTAATYRDCARAAQTARSADLR